MITINTVDAQKFSLNGINYYKNFLSLVSGTHLIIYNAYDRRDERVSSTIFSDFILNGVTYGNAGLLQDALMGVIYTRTSLGVGGGSGFSEYQQNYTYNGGVQQTTIPATLLITGVTLNEGRLLKKNIDYTVSGTVITFVYALDVDDTVYIQGLI